MDRRTLLQLLSSSLIVPAEVRGQMHCGPADQTGKASAEPYRFQFFSPEKVSLLESVMEKIIPKDEHSPGAREARVIEFADLMIATGPDEIKQDWRIGTRLLASEIQHEGLDSWLEAVSAKEEDPQNVLEVFFRSLKQMTINGYYSSAIGIHGDLHYQGNTHVSVFEGCNHSEHKAHEAAS